MMILSELAVLEAVAYQEIWLVQMLASSTLMELLEALVVLVALEAIHL